MITTPPKDTRVLLSIYPKNALRLKRLEVLHKINGMTRTRWLNRAITEKLDREHPETDCPDADYTPAPIPLDSADARNAYEVAQRQYEAARKQLEAFGAAPMVEPLEKPVPVAKLAEDQETDFWQDNAFEKVRANVKKHLR